MRRSDFSYDLPAELIAQLPSERRGIGRLLQVDSRQGCWTDRQFTDLPMLLRAGDVLVLNDTRVIPARLIGAKPTGGRVEVLLERVLDKRRVLAQVHASKPLRANVPILFANQVRAHVLGRQEDLFELQFTVEPQAFFQQHGVLPLPPYIERTPDAIDQERYQTVFARTLGAVAAPTAGLHFDAAMLARCVAMGVQLEYLTLHVGAGTFKPVRVDDLDQHVMHAESVQVSDTVCQTIATARARGGRVIAVGTTVVRSLEAAAATGQLRPFTGETRLFIRPGYRFQVVDALLTNFHLSESTLLMLVCAFGGYETIMAAYRHAVAARYRFFSYGDAMWIAP